MTRIADALGQDLSGADAVAAALFDRALAELRCFRGDPVGHLDAALARCPGFAMAHAMKAWILLLSTEPGLVPAAAGAAAAAARHAGTERERGHAAALAQLVAGRWHASGAALAELSRDHPRDSLALFAGHQIDYVTGNAAELRDRIARALPAWDAAMPGFHSLLSMHAFGLEETGAYAEAEAQGRRAVELEPRDGWAQHAVAHVFEMTDRPEAGIAWMRGSDAWAGDSFLQGHNWWHLALFHLERGDPAEALALYDAAVYPDRSRLVLRMVDASALLWRLGLLGIETGGRWQALAEDWAGVPAGRHAFNDVHAVMAFVGAGQADRAAGVLAAQEEAAAGGGDNARFAAEVGLPAARALIAFGEGDWRRAASLLAPLRAVAHRFGGSHAQRDVLDLTLIEAAIRSGDPALALGLAAERRSRRPRSPLAADFAARAAAMAG